MKEAMKHIAVESVREPEPDYPGDRTGGNPGPGNSAGPWHSITVSCSPAAYPEDESVLERCFKELVQYYRHSSVGRGSLGIVHRMNTPLQVLSFQLDLLEQKAREEMEIFSAAPPGRAAPLITLNRHRQEKLRQCRHELDKLINLSRSLVLQGAHEDTQEKSPLDLNQLSRLELELYLNNPFFKHRVGKEFHFGDHLPLVKGHYIDFSQSFRNLIDNALEAMEGMDHPGLTVVTTCREGRLTVSIGDTGRGIPPGDLPRIFEPFFTTKGSGGRAGLGLFMVRRLLAPYRAEIRVDSGPGGTWARLLIPV